VSLFGNIVGVPLGYLMDWCYRAVDSYGPAVLLFALLTRLLLFPLSFAAHKNSITMARLAPRLADIRRYHAGDSGLILEEQKKLYKDEKYRPFLGVLPLLAQIPVVLGFIDVIYHPLQRLLHMDAGTAALFTARAAQIMGTTADKLGFGAQLAAIRTIKTDPAAFGDMESVPGQVLQVLGIDTRFLGFDLSAAPSLTGVTLIIPLLSGLSALALCLEQNRRSLMRTGAGSAGGRIVTIFMVCFSVYFAYALPCALGLYWTATNMFSILVLWLCYRIYDPKEFLDVLAPLAAGRPDRKARRIMAQEKRVRARREKDDMRRFYAGDNTRELVFYAEAGGFYKYFRGYIERIISRSDIVVHYVTSDAEDAVFKMEDPRVRPYYIADQAIVEFFLRMDADVVVMTTPDLHTYHIKRSIVRKDVEYVYTDHGMTSFHLTLRKGALDHFDTIFCNGPNHVEEVRLTEWVYGLPQKTLVKTGFPLLDDLLRHVAELTARTANANAGAGNVEINKAYLTDATDAAVKTDAAKRILIAPSWQKHNILDSCFDEVLSALLGKDYAITVRPHPEFTKRFPDKIQVVMLKYAHLLGGELTLETDIASDETVYGSDILITDWSSIAQEFSYATKRPTIFINTPMKVMNPEYKRIPGAPLDLTLRDELGVSVEPAELSGLGDIVSDLLNDGDRYRRRITEALERHIYNVGHGAENGADYVIGRVLHRRALRNALKREVNEAEGKAGAIKADDRVKKTEADI
jgi:YidC/Oxa1 family membrane protein insertase